MVGLLIGMPRWVGGRAIGWVLGAWKRNNIILQIWAGYGLMESRDGGVWGVGNAK